MKNPIIHVQWTNEAKQSFEKNIDWVTQNWTEREVQKFIFRTQKMIEILQQHPESCRPSQKRKNVRIGILNKHTQIVYHYKKNVITILLFWTMKQNPIKFKY